MAGEVDALPEALGGEQGRARPGPEPGHQFRAGQPVLDQHLVAAPGGQGVGRAVHGRPGGEQGQGPAAGGGDQLVELVGHRLGEAGVVGLGEVLGDVEPALAGMVEGARHGEGPVDGRRRLHVRTGAAGRVLVARRRPVVDGRGQRQAEAAGEEVEPAAGGQRGAGGDDRHLGVEPGGQRRADVDGRLVELGTAPVGLDPGHRVGRRVEQEGDVVGQPVEQAGGLGRLGPGDVAATAGAPRVPAPTSAGCRAPPGPASPPWPAPPPAREPRGVVGRGGEVDPGRLRRRAERRVESRRPPVRGGGSGRSSAPAARARAAARRTRKGVSRTPKASAKVSSSVWASSKTTAVWGGGRCRPTPGGRRRGGC